MSLIPRDPLRNCHGEPAFGTDRLLEEHKEELSRHRCPACGCFTEYASLSNDWNEFALYGHRCNNCDWSEE